MGWRKIKTESIIHNRHVEVKKNEVELPNGFIIPDFYTVTIPDGNKPLNEMQKEIIKQCVDKARTPQELLAILVMYKGLF